MTNGTLSVSLKDNAQTTRAIVTAVGFCICLVPMAVGIINFLNEGKFETELQNAMRMSA